MWGGSFRSLPTQLERYGEEAFGVCLRSWGGTAQGVPPPPPPRPGQPWEGAAELQGFLTCLQLNCSLPQQV